MSFLRFAGCIPALGALAVGLCSAWAHAELRELPALQSACCGSVERLYLYSPEMEDTINVDVWLPENFKPGSGLSVVYMHDGQNLFDASTTWNHQAWEMDSVACSLIDAGVVKPMVIVGVHSVDSTRLADLMPENVLPLVKDPLSEEGKAFMHQKHKLRGNAYAAFLAKTLRSEMLNRYGVSESADSTFVMGSSMGGLMSLYAMSEYPEVFGAAACLSTHWIGTLDGNKAFEDAMMEYLARKLPRDGHHRLYLDRGNLTLDAYYGPSQARAIDHAVEAGYSVDDGTLYIYYDPEGAHEERSWARRVAIPLTFLLK